MAGFNFCVKRKIRGLWSLSRTIGCKNSSYSVRVFIIAVHSFVSVESPSSACVNSFEFAEIRFFPLCDCNNAAPMPKFEASHIV